AGTLLYGQSPVTPPADFAPAETFCAFARIVAVHDLAAGEKIGYGGDYTVKAPLRAAVVAAGYGDGFCLEPQSRQGKGDIVRAAIKNSARALGNKPRYYFMAGNKRLPLLGRVAMQMSCCDISGTDLKVGDIVRLPLRRTCASALLPRLYFQGGKIVACRGFSEDK
ncbi:MAG: alanine racemase C-terminal domain-containing protein, partial [Clostridia bacterium]|nr:alanine racemase C-terminal domain-containing protein [Clostridia bacterium]